MGLSSSPFRLGLGLGPTDTSPTEKEEEEIPDDKKRRKTRRWCVPPPLWAAAAAAAAATDGFPQRKPEEGGGKNTSLFRAFPRYKTNGPATTARRRRKRGKLTI